MMKTPAIRSLAFAPLALALICAAPSQAAEYAAGQYQALSPELIQRVVSAAEIQGAWIGAQDNNSMALIFMGSNCGMIYNNMQIMGTYTLSENQLNMTFQNGQSVSYSIVVQGDLMVLDNQIRLKRTNVQVPGAEAPQSGGWNGAPQPNGGWGGNAQNNGAPQNGGWGAPQDGGWGSNAQNNGAPQNGGWGAPQDGGWGGNAQNNGAPQNGGWGSSQGNDTAQNGGWGAPQGGGWGGNTQQNGYGSVLEGQWGGQSQDFQGRQMQINIIFSGSRYVFLVNGQQTEVGNFRYDQQSGRFDYQVTAGPNQGQSGTNQIRVQGNQLVMITQAGGQLYLTRQR